MSAFTVGYDMNGNPTSGLDYTQAINIIALIISCIYLVGSIMVLGLLFTGRLGLKAKAFNFIACTNILYFIWIVLQFVNYSPYCVPFLSWLFNLLGELGIFLTVMGQMDILKSFVFGSHYLNKEIITKLQIGYAVYHTVCMAGLYGIIGSIGQPRSLFLEQWYVYGYELFAFSAILYENFHAIYISRELVKHKQFRNNSSANTVEMHILFRLVLLGIVVDWTAFIIWIISWFIGGSNASGLAAIGATVGMGHILVMSIIFRQIRRVSLEKSVDSSKDTSAMAHS
ncbi:hypothetical protein HDV04_003435 [Boothiomyces sp. JEL0838]|nr:hypothetical protein HDV04_003435 [Boothiomyces sp. JEL0838]